MRFRNLLLCALPLLLCSCLGMPKGIKPVNNFDVGSYMGQWYEIARMENSFEKGLDHVTANYSLNDDKSVKVINQGYHQKKGETKIAEGTAKFVKSTDTGYLKVSFFKPFYSSYVVFKLDPNYQYAYVSGYNKKYLWLLSRTPTISDAVLKDFYKTAKTYGYDTSKIIQVEQQ